MVSGNVWQLSMCRVTKSSDPMEMKGWLSPIRSKFQAFEVLRVGRRWNGGGRRIIDFYCMTSGWGVDCSMSSLIDCLPLWSEGHVTVWVVSESATVSTSPYHDMAVYGTSCLSNFGDESLFIWMRDTMDVEWMWKWWSLQVPLSVLQVGRAPHTTSPRLLVLWLSVGFGQWKLPATDWTVRGDLSEYFSPSSSLFQRPRLSPSTTLVPASNPSALISGPIGFCEITFLLLPLRHRGSNHFLLPSPLAGSLNSVHTSVTDPFFKLLKLNYLSRIL